MVANRCAQNDSLPTKIKYSAFIERYEILVSFWSATYMNCITLGDHLLSCLFFLAHSNIIWAQLWSVPSKSYKPTIVDLDDWNAIVDLNMMRFSTICIHFAEHLLQFDTIFMKFEHERSDIFCAYFESFIYTLIHFFPSTFFFIIIFYCFIQRNFGRKISKRKYLSLFLKEIDRIWLEFKTNKLKYIFKCQRFKKKRHFRGKTHFQWIYFQQTFIFCWIYAIFSVESVWNCIYWAKVSRQCDFINVSQLWKNA